MSHAKQESTRKRRSKHPAQLLKHPQPADPLEDVVLWYLATER